MNYHQANTLAKQFAAALDPYCEMIRIAGSLRRRVEEVKDIEIVCLATMAEVVDRDMFGIETGRRQINRTFEALPAVMKATGWKIGNKDGDRYKQLKRVTYYDIALDLFVIHEPRRWGACFTIRTGPAKFNIELMKYINRHSQHVQNNLLHGHAKMWGRKEVGGYVSLPCEKGDTCPLIINTPSEASFFRAIDLPPVSPDLRSVKWLKNAVAHRIQDKARNRRGV